MILIWMNKARPSSLRARKCSQNNMMGVEADNLVQNILYKAGRLAQNRRRFLGTEPASDSHKGAQATIQQGEVTALIMYLYPRHNFMGNIHDANRKDAPCAGNGDGGHQGNNTGDTIPSPEGNGSEDDHAPGGS